MSFEKNQKKIDRIIRFGQTVDLPLFQQPETAGDRKNYPNWIWNGTGVKAEVWQQIKDSHKLNEDAFTVLKAMIELGGKATDNEIEKKTGLRINIVTGRRNDLVKIGYVQSFGKKKLGPSGRSNTIWQVNYKNLYEGFTNENI